MQGHILKACDLLPKQLMIYLDYAASTKVLPEVKEAMLPFFDDIFANPSSVHTAGQKAHLALNTARKNIASYLHCSPNEILFTGGASESIATCLFSVAHTMAAYGKHIILSAIEHSSSLEVGKRIEKEGFRVTYLLPDHDGLISVQAVEQALEPDTILVSIMYVNNEVGTIQPIPDIGALLQKKKIFFHTDASQAYPYLPCHVDELHVNALTLAGYKCGAPKGIGLLYYTKNSAFEALIPGHQEFEMRGGTQNVPYIVGLAKAMEITEKERDANTEKMKQLRDYCIAHIQKIIPNTVINGTMEQRVANNINMSFLGTNAETLVIRLDMDEIAVSQGSACTSESKEPSHVLKALNIPDEVAVGALRITLGNETSEQDIDTFIEKLAYHVAQIRHRNITY